jgi:uncharacterized membrane protein YgaE (UPF0421/DUF939 family)
MQFPQPSLDHLRPRPGWPQRVLSEQLHPAIRAVIAAIVAWEVGLTFGPPQAAYFAVFTALAANYPTVARSVTQTLYYAASVLASILLVFAVDSITHTTVTGLALAIGAAIIVGRAPIFGRSGGTIAFWSLLLIVMGGDPPSRYLSQRLPEAALGLVLGVTINLLLFPRLRFGPVRSGVHTLREDLADVLDATAHELTDDWPPHDPDWTDRDARLERRSAALQEAASDTVASMRWNPRAKLRLRRTRTVRQHLTRTESLQRITLAVAGIVRTLEVAARQEGTPAALNSRFREAYAQLLARLVEPLRADAEHGGEQHPADLTEFSRDLRELQTAVDAARHEDPTVWLSEALLLLQISAICAELDSEEVRTHVRFPALQT